MTTPTTTGTAAKKTAPSRTSTAKPSPEQPSPSRTVSSLSDHLAVVQEGDVMGVDELYAFLESMRALVTGLAFFSEAASTQLEAAMRKGARDQADGRLTLGQKAKLKLVLRQINRDLEGVVKDALLDSARGSVKAWARMEAFLDEVESANVSRPHRSSRGGFSLGGR